MVAKKGKSVSLRGKKDAVGRKPTLSFRCPPELRRYIDDTTKSTGRDQTEVIIDALALDRDLAAILRPVQGQLEEYAETSALDMDKDLAVVLARLVMSGLEAVEAKRPKR